MSQTNRLSSGGLIARDKPITIRFNGREVPAYEGDSVASALLANGIVHVGRSFKYHRPRGVMAAGSEEANALLDVDRGSGRREPNNRASVVEAFDGLDAKSQNHWPSLERDVGVLNDVASPLFSAGFYYKTFMWPPTAWAKVYEPFIRRAAGLGMAPTTPDPDQYVHAHAHADILIAGGGPAGLAAALAASADGKRVILADEKDRFGGTLLYDVTSTIDEMSPRDWVTESLATLSQRPNVRLLARTTVFGAFNHNHIALAERLTDHLSQPQESMARERLWQVRAKQMIVATGAHERPLVFANNDRPGIMLADAMRCYLNRYAVTLGRRVVIATSGASAYETALDAKAAGLDVTIVDTRPRTAIGAEGSLAREAGIEVLDGYTILGSTGRTQVTGLVVAPVGPDGHIGAARTLGCEGVGISGGWTPVVHLFSQARGKLDFDAAIDAFVPGRGSDVMISAGACRGRYGLGSCLDDGFLAGRRAAGDAPCSGPKPSFDVESRDLNGFEAVRVLPTNRNSMRDKAFVDFQNDVTAKDLKLAVQEGFQSIEHVKRYTTTGMATDQGKTSNMNALGFVSEMLGATPPDIGTTTFRPPYTPVTFGAFAGQSRGKLFDPERVTPSHNWAAARGAAFEDVGLWKRAWYFPEVGETMRAAVLRECRAVRERVGIFDGSTLGKIEVVGPDAAEFLNRIYTNSWLKLKPGRCRYGLMLKEDGYIMDDGVVARLAADRFHVTTTTGGAPRVLAHMEDYLQTEFTDLDLALAATTEQWAVIALQGPKARDVIRPLVTDIDLSDERLPFMGVAEGRIGGVPCRLFRVSFTGEFGYEINVPADYGAAVWEAVFAAGEPHGITPYGTESMHVLRAEAGFIIVGQETDGTVTADDVGLSGLVSKIKADFVGKRSLARPDLVAGGRKQLIGLLTDEPSLVLDEGAQIVADPGQPIPMDMLGHVTSSYLSPNVLIEGRPRSIAMALVRDGRDRTGSTLHVTTERGFATAKVVTPKFLEADGGQDNG
jgi:sarcosine oxidase subunit alpha